MGLQRRVQDLRGQAPGVVRAQHGRVEALVGDVGRGLVAQVGPHVDGVPERERLLGEDAQPAAARSGVALEVAEHRLEHRSVALVDPGRVREIDRRGGLRAELLAQPVLPVGREHGEHVVAGLEALAREGARTARELRRVVVDQSAVLRRAHDGSTGNSR